MHGERGGTWGSGEAAADWQHGVEARLQMFGPATERLLDLANIRAGSRVLDIGAGSGDQTLGAARRAGPTGRVLATDIPGACSKSRRPPLGRRDCRTSTPE